MTQYWIFKTEPSDFSIDDLKRDGVTVWSGTRNYQVRNFMRDLMHVGDLVLIYHSSCEIPGIAGVGKITKKAEPDSTQFQKKSKYYDPKSKKENPTWLSVEVSFIKKFKDFLPLTELKKNSKLKNLRILQKGNRLSITPVSKKEFDEITK